MANNNFRSSSMASVPHLSVDISEQRSESAPPLRHTSLDCFRAKVQPLVIVRPATADDSDSSTSNTWRSHPLELWEINYDEIFPQSARLAREFACTARTSFQPTTAPASQAAFSVASASVPAAAAATSQVSAPRLSESTRHSSCSFSSSESSAIPTSPPTISIPSVRRDLFAAHVPYPELRSRVLGCPLGTPCVAAPHSPAERSPDASAWDADDEKPRTAAGHWGRRSSSASGRQPQDRIARGGNLQERARGISPPVVSRPRTGERVLLKRASDPPMRSPSEYPRHVHPDGRQGHVGAARHRLSRSSSKDEPTVVRLQHHHHERPNGQQLPHEQISHAKHRQSLHAHEQQQLLASLQRKLELSKLVGEKLARSSKLFPSSASVGSTCNQQQQQHNNTRSYTDLTHSYLSLEMPRAFPNHKVPSHQRRFGSDSLKQDDGCCVESGGMLRGPSAMGTSPWRNSDGALAAGAQERWHKGAAVPTAAVTTTAAAAASASSSSAAAAVTSATAAAPSAVGRYRLVSMC